MKASTSLLMFVLVSTAAAGVEAGTLPWPLPNPCAPAGCSSSDCTRYNLVVDGDFSYGCPQWVFGEGTSREEGPFCTSSHYSTRAVFTGHDGTGTLHQDIAVRSDLGSQLQLGYYFEKTWYAGWSDQVVVTLRDAATGAVLQTVYTHRGGTSGCYQFNASLGDYRGQTIRLQFDSTVGLGPAFRLDNVELWQGT